MNEQTSERAPLQNENRIQNSSRDTATNEKKTRKMVAKPMIFSVCDAALHGTLSWLMGELNKQQLNIFLFGHRLLHFVSSLFQMSRLFFALSL